VTTYDVGNVLAYTVTGLSPNTAYTVTARAYDSGGVRGADTAPLSVTTTAVGVTVPGAPTGVTAAANGVTGQIVVTWTPPVSDGGSAIIDYQVNTSGHGPVTGSSVYDAIPIAGLTDGTSYTFTVQARNAIGLSATSAPVSAAPTVANFHIRVNAGGPAYTDGSGNIWSADTGFTGGTAAADPGGVTSTPDPGLFLWERWGMSQYQFTGLANGTYHVDLMMAEQSAGAPGYRIFSATANGQAIFTNLDLFATAGSLYKAVTRSIDIAVNSGTLTLGFTSSVDFALVDAIHIFLPTTGISSAAASLSAVASLSAIGRGVSTGTKAFTATAVLQASAVGTANQGAAGLAAHAVLSAVPVTGGTIDVGNTLAYTIANLLPATSYTITVRAYDGVGVRGVNSSPLSVTTLTATPVGAASFVAFSALSAFGIGVARGTAPLQAAAALVATTSAPIKPGVAIIVAHAIISATAASPGPIAGSATLTAASAVSVFGLEVASSATAALQAASSLVATAAAPIKPAAAAVVATATLLATPVAPGPIAAIAHLVADTTLSTVGLEIALASPALAATSQLIATGSATSIANLTSTSALVATATTFGVRQASAQLAGTSTLNASADTSVMMAVAPLVAAATLFGDPTGTSIRVGSASLLASSALFASTVATVRTGSAALVATPSVVDPTGTQFTSTTGLFGTGRFGDGTFGGGTGSVVPPPPLTTVFGMPRLIVEIAVTPGPNLDASKTGTPNGLQLNSPNTSLGTSVLGSVRVWTEITSDVLHLDYSYGRSSGPLSDLTQPLVGSANITLENFDGNYDPANPNGTFANGSGGTLLLPLRQIQVRAEWAGITYPLWHGYVEEYAPDYGTYPTVVLQCVGPLALLAAAPVPKVDPPTYGGERPGARINRILDTVNWPTSLRDVDPGHVAAMPNAVFGDNALRLCQDVAIAEGGMIFSSGQLGAITFYDRDRLYKTSRSLSVQAVFGDTDANNTIDYLGIAVSYGAATIANSITLNRVGGIAQTADDATSQFSYGRRELPGAPSDLQLTSDNQTLAVANWFLQQYKDPDLRVSEISIDGLPQSMWPAILALTLWDRVEVKRQYSPAYSFDKQLIVQGITHTIVPFQSWSVKLNTQSPTTLAPFDFPQMILDTSSGVGIGALGY
jgi:hypothetical protein